MRCVRLARNAGSRRTCIAWNGALLMSPSRWLIWSPDQFSSWRTTTTPTYKASRPTEETPTSPTCLLSSDHGQEVGMHGRIYVRLRVSLLRGLGPSAHCRRAASDGCLFQTSRMRPFPRPGVTCIGRGRHFPCQLMSIVLFCVHPSMPRFGWRGRPHYATPPCVVRGVQSQSRSYGPSSTARLVPASARASTAPGDRRLNPGQKPPAPPSNAGEGPPPELDRIARHALKPLGALDEALQLLLAS